MNSNIQSYPKIALVASSGGHLVQLCRVYEHLSPSRNLILLTTARYSQVPVPLQAIRFHILPDANMRTPLRLLHLTLVSARTIWRERPDVVITTGAAPGAICIILAKLLLRSRCVWIDSLANAQKMSFSGRLVKSFSDLWLSQWEDVANRHGATYLGKVI